MDSLLELAVAAHGGRDRWQQITQLKAHISVGGALWHVKGWPGIFPYAHVELDPHRQHIEFSPFQKAGQHTLFEPDRVAIVGADGKILDERRSPRQAFEGHGLQTPWDALHLAYFTGYAMWDYLTMPFLFLSPGFHTAEIEPWHENGEIWRRLKVIFPAEVHSHCREQVFYFDSAGLVRRHDYRVDIIGSGSTSAHYSSGHKTFGGIVFPTSRQVYTIDSDNRPNLERVLVSLDIHEVDVT
jgi:hypothetical protein